VTDESVKEKLANAMAAEFERDLEIDNLPPDEIQKLTSRSQKRIIGGPVVIILCLDMSEMDVYPDKKRGKAEYLMAVQSVANAGMQMLLASHAEGLGGVWVCSPLFVQETIQLNLALPKTWEPQAMIILGYPADIPISRERKSTHDITIYK